MAKVVLAKKAAKRQTISALMIKMLGGDIECPFERLLAGARKINPKTRFSRGCANWYRSKIANGRLKGMA